MDEQPQKPPKYDWGTWMRRPFRTFIVEPYNTYGRKPHNFRVILRTHASRHGLGVTASTEDPMMLGRVAFRFFDTNDRYYSGATKPHTLFDEEGMLDRRPLLEDTTPDDQGTANHSNPFDAVSFTVPVRCRICDKVQDRPEHLSHIEECIETGAVNPGRLYATHRHADESADNNGLREFDQFMVMWDLKNGPN